MKTISMPVFNTQDDVIEALKKAETPDQRKAIKALGFGALFGASKLTIAQMLENEGYSTEDIKTAMETYYENNRI